MKQQEAEALAAMLYVASTSLALHWSLACCRTAKSEAHPRFI